MSGYIVGLAWCEPSVNVAVLKWYLGTDLGLLLLSLTFNSVVTLAIHFIKFFTHFEVMKILEQNPPLQQFQKTKHYKSKPKTCRMAGN